MFNFSTKTQVNKDMKVLDVLKKIGADKEVKLDATKINKITLVNIINKNSINSLKDSKYSPIYVIQIELKKRKYHLSLLNVLIKI